MIIQPQETLTEAIMSTGTDTNELPCGTKFPNLFAALSADFDPADVKLLPKGGRQLKYITARTVANRLDDVLGPDHWWDDYIPGSKSVICRLSIQLPDGRVITKADAGGFAGMADAGDDEKSGFSDAFKRAAQKFGIGRNQVYGEGMAQFHHDGEVKFDEPAPQQHRQPEYREPPRQQQQQQQRQPDRQSNGNGGTGNTPRSGKALFAWCKEMEGKYGVGLIKYINGWAKLQELPERMIDFDAEQVALAHGEAVRKIRTLQPQHAANGNGQPHHDDAVEDVRNDIRRSYGPGADDDMQGV